jgi:hypothetical protein
MKDAKELIYTLLRLDLTHVEHNHSIISIPLVLILCLLVLMKLIYIYIYIYIVHTRKWEREIQISDLYFLSCGTQPIELSIWTSPHKLRVQI